MLRDKAGRRFDTRWGIGANSSWKILSEQGQGAEKAGRAGVGAERGEQLPRRCVRGNGGPASGVQLDEDSDRAISLLGISSQE